MNTILILAGGMSSRMKASKEIATLSPAEVKAANSQNKGLIILEGDKRPVLDYLIKNCALAGFNKVVLITGENQLDFKRYYGSPSKNNTLFGLKIDFAVQHIPEGRIKPHGTADAVYQALNQFPELQEQEFAVCNCDNLYSVNALKLLQKTTANNAFIAYNRDGLEFPVEKIARFAICKLNASQELELIIEKPHEATINQFRDLSGKLRVSMNIFKFNGSDFYPFLKNCPEQPTRKEKELPTAILNMINQGEAKVLGIPLEEHVPDLTTKADIAVFKEYLKQ